MNLLAGDIGGTKTLLGIYRFNGNIELLYKKHYLSNEWSNKLNFIHSEIYSNPNEIKGDLSNAKISEAAKEWNLPSEPWTFVINESGVIISKFEGFATKEEIEESIKTILN